MPRFYYLDCLRSILMLLVVALHTANVYSVSSTWIVSDPNGSLVFDGIAAAISLFVMPAFFLIAGFFSLMSLRRAGPNGFLTSRLMRLLIPLVATVLVVNSTQAYVCSLFRGGHTSGVVDFVCTDLPRRWRQGGWVEHLWFLNVLIAYSVVVFAVCKWTAIPRWLGGERGRRWLAYAGKTVWPWLLLLPLWSLVAPALGKLAPDVVYRVYCCGFVNPVKVTRFLPFFLVGMWLFYDAEFRSRLARLRPWHAVLILAAFFVWRTCDPEGAFWQKSLHAYAGGLLTWLLCVLCLSLSHRFLDRPSRAFAYLSDASYTVYLFQQLFVVVLAFTLFGLPVAAAVKFAFVLCVAIGAGLAIHHFLVLRIRFVRLLFNGRTS